MKYILEKQGRVTNNFLGRFETLKEARKEAEFWLNNFTQWEKKELDSLVIYDEDENFVEEFKIK